ncbi:cation diffusion facilitator family transporter [Kineosporia rhizophila]|uniref:cation diffusion facilitator family transporter n=1 Tax=Kineosporia TaxID=49184 RepID=UPI000A83539F|nr:MULTISPECIES: cation diffusion facilitator family transporter [Kineosporia]MCE0534871.1 cation diffusion facilitator family transporter [Kineosporia rhizophila]GLY14849.1 transporter [Kineosporia sp. NBRC 101677]
MSTEGGSKAIIAALSANLGIAATKFVAFGLTGSSSMLAEGIHSVADSGNQVLLLVGGRRAKKKPNEEHPFGYGRSRYLFAFLVSVILFSVGGLFALYEAWHKWDHPEPIENWQWVPVAVLVAAIAMEGFSLRTAVHEATPHREGRNWWRFIRETKSPELPVVLLEDTAALTGLVFALFGVGMTLATHDGRWDAVGSAMIGLLLIAVAVILALETSSLLVGEGASAEDLDRIKTALVGAGVHGVIHIRTLYVGPEELMVAAKIAVVPTESAVEVAEAIDEAEARVRAAVPTAKLIFLEPDIARGTGGPAGVPAN